MTSLCEATYPLDSRAIRRLCDQFGQGHRSPPCPLDPAHSVGAFSLGVTCRPGVSGHGHTLAVRASRSLGALGPGTAQMASVRSCAATRVEASIRESHPGGLSASSRFPVTSCSPEHRYPPRRSLAHTTTGGTAPWRRVGADPSDQPSARILSTSRLPSIASPSTTMSRWAVASKRMDAFDAKSSSPSQ